VQIDVREIGDNITIDTISFGDDEYLSCDDLDNEIFTVRSEDKIVNIYLDSIDNMIVALQKAKELWV